MPRPHKLHQVLGMLRTLRKSKMLQVLKTLRTFKMFRIFRTLRVSGMPGAFGAFQIFSTLMIMMLMIFKKPMTSRIFMAFKMPKTFKVLKMHKISMIFINLKTARKSKTQETCKGHPPWSHRRPPLYPNPRCRPRPLLLCGVMNLMSLLSTTLTPLLMSTRARSLPRRMKLQLQRLQTMLAI